MDIADSSLWREIQAIVNSGAKDVHHTWDITIYAGTEVIKPFKLMSIDYNRDYLNNYTDYILLNVKMPLGTFARRLYPNLDNLEIEIKRVTIGETSDATNLDDPTQAERYTAVIIDTGNPIVENAIGSTTNEEDLNRIDVPTVEFQLFNKALEQIRVLPAGGIYRNMTGEAVVKAVLTKYSQMAVVDGQRQVNGVQMVEAANQTKRSVIDLPQNLKMVDVPHHVHYYCGGLYAAGLGYYLQDDYWYVFPAYDNTRFNDGDPTLTIINIPEHRLPGIERTYRKDGDNLVILATGQSKFRDIRNTAQLNQGNGARFADAEKIMDSFVTVKDNKAIAARAQNNTEIISDKRPNNINLVTDGRNRITANPFVEYSALAARQGSGINVVWENADHTLLYPGMPTKYTYLDGDDIQELYGVLLGAHQYISLREPGMTSQRYVNIMTLSVFVKPLAPETDDTPST